MRAWPAILLLVTLAVASTPLFTGCKSAAPKATPTAEAKSEGHEHEAEKAQAKEGAEGKAEEPTPTPSAPPSAHAQEISKQLRSDDDLEVLAALARLGDVTQASDRDSIKADVRRLLTKADVSAEVRTAAVQAWDPWAADDPQPLLGLCGSPHVPVRAAVATSLTKLQGAPIDAALGKLRQDPDSTVKAIAAEALATHLGHAEGDKAIDALIADLGHPDGDRSAQAGIKLEQRGRGKDGDKRVLVRLAHFLRTSASPAQRHSCATVMALICAGTSPGQKAFASSVNAQFRQGSPADPADERGIEPLTQALLHDPEPMVREVAAFGLGLIGSAKAAPALGRALRDPDEDVRRRAAAALVIVPADSVAEALATAARRDSSPAVRRFAVEAMAQLNGDQAAYAVARSLRDPDAEVRLYACEVLEKIGTRKQTEGLIWLFDDPVEDVRWKAVEAVAHFADPSAKAALVQALDDPCPRVALAAERGVHRLGIRTRVLTKEELAGARRPAQKG